MNTTQIGDISEQRFVLHCMQNDVPICKPVGNNLPYDFIIEYNNKLLKVQVKTAYKNNGVVSDIWTFNTRSCSKNYTEITTRGYDGLIDYFAVVRPDREEIIMVPIERATKGGMNISYEEICKSNQNHYKDFILF